MNDRGQARMVDISDKQPTARVAVARAVLRMSPATAGMLAQGGLPKGDALPVARTAGILAAKKTPDLIPLCHPIAITKLEIDFQVDAEAGLVTVLAEARTTDRTGIEMEALTAAATAALTIYDMCKSVQKDIEIANIVLLEKTGGKSGPYKRND